MRNSAHICAADRIPAGEDLRRRAVVWQDPDFDPALSAVYYVRVLEIPTPRWSTYDNVRSGIPLPDGVPLSIQERA